MRVPVRLVAKKIATSKNPGATAGKLARGVLTASHPIVGGIVGKKVETGVANLVDKGVSKLQDPNFRRNAMNVVRRGVSAIRSTQTGGRVMGKVDAFRATPVGQAAERQVRRLGTQTVAKINEFQTGQQKD